MKYDSTLLPYKQFEEDPFQQCTFFTGICVTEQYNTTEHRLDMFICPVTVCSLTKHKLLCKNHYIYYMGLHHYIEILSISLLYDSYTLLYICIYVGQTHLNGDDWTMLYEQTEPEIWPKALWTDHVTSNILSTHDISIRSVTSWHCTKVLNCIWFLL